MIPIYYINLDERLDRREFMEQQFAGLGLQAARIPAITPDQIGSEELAQSPLRPQVLACTKSHESAWRRLLDENHRMAVILEDDAILSASLPGFLANLPEIEFDLLRFEATGRSIRVFPPVATSASGVDIRPFRSATLGSCGYIISRNGVAKIAGHPRLTRVPIDAALYDRFEEPGALLVRYHADPGLCMQANDLVVGTVGQSNIDAGSHRSPLSFRSMLKGVVNTFDHFASIRQGLTREVIRFSSD